MDEREQLLADLEARPDAWFHFFTDDTVLTLPTPPGALARLGPRTRHFATTMVDAVGLTTLIRCFRTATTQGAACAPIHLAATGADSWATLIDFSAEYGTTVMVLTDDPPPEDLRSDTTGPAPSDVRTASLLVDGSGGIIEATGTLVDHHGIAAAQAGGHSVLSLVHPQDADRLIDAYLSALSATSQTGYARVRLGRDDEWGWIDIHLLVTEIDGVAITHCTLTDIDEEVSAFAALRDSERLLRTITEAIPGGVFMMDLAGTMIFANAACYEMLDTAPGTSGFDLVTQLDPPSRDRLVADWRTMLAEGALDTEVTMSTTSRVMRIRAHRVDDADGSATAVAGSLEDVTERARVAAQIAHQASHDALTNLANRTGLDAHLRDRLAGRDGSTTAVIFVDLDDFKQVNDSLGHRVGDEVLAELGARITAVVKADDFVARFGGDEFVVVTRCEHGVHEAVDLAHRLVRSINAPIHLAGRTIRSNASVGVASSQLSGLSADDLIRDADTAMYRSKIDGRHSVVVADEDLAAEADRHLVYCSSLGDAIRRDELTLVYQPIVYDRSPVPVAYESLLRWNHPELGPVPPLDIITTAEKMGLIESLTLWIIARVAADAARIRVGMAASPVQPSLAINLSFSQLEIPGIRQVLLANAGRFDISPEALVLEVTETKLINASDDAASAIADLSAAGFALALDDFGTGYSSLEYLTRLPFASLKIDRAIVSRVGTNESARRIVGAIHAMCTDLGMTVIAEGVETAAELDACRQLGLTEFQGYHLGRPAPLETWMEVYGDDAGRVVTAPRSSR